MAPGGMFVSAAPPPVNFVTEIVGAQDPPGLLSRMAVPESSEAPAPVT